MSTATTILGIDDDPEIETLLKKIFESVGYIYHHVKNLEAAETFLNKNMPDIMLLDIGLGEDYGLDIYDKPKNQEKLKKTKVIVLSAANTAADVQMALAIGVDDYMVKPINKETLLEKVKKHLKT